MRKITLNLASLVMCCSLLFVACQEKDFFGEIQEEGKTPFTEEVKVPSSFNWQAIKKVQLKVIPLSRFGDSYNYEITVYDRNPYSENAKTISKGYASTAKYFTAELTVPDYLTAVFVKQSMEDTSGEKHTMVKEMTLNGKEIICDFTNESYPAEEEAAAAPTRSMSPAINKAPTNISVPSNAQEITGSNFSTQKNGIYVLSVGNSFTGNFNWSDCQNTRIYIMGDFSPSNAMELNNSARMYIGPDGSVTATHFRINSSARIENQGKFKVDTFRMGGPSNALTNYGQMELQTFTVPSNAEIKNYCYINTSTLSLESCKNVILGTESYTGTDNFTMNNTELKIEENAILDIRNNSLFISNNSIKASPNKAEGLVKINTVTAYWKGLNVKGTLQVYFKTPNNYNSNYIKFDNKVNIVNNESETLSINPSGCNGKGNNTATNLINPNPSPQYPITVVNETSYTYLIEDLWPYLGDFDMNDVVVSVKTAYDLTDENYISNLKITTTLHAVGSARLTGVAIQLDKISSNLVQSVTDIEGTRTFETNTYSIAANGIEAAQTKAVIPILDDAHKALTGQNNNIPTNTYMDATYYTPITNTVEISFTPNSVTKDQITPTDLNVFIIESVLSPTRRKEVHLSGYAATDLANPDYFDKGDDRSSTVKSYTTANNLVWGMMVANTTETFIHTQEKVLMQKAFPLFIDWITTNSDASKAWYLRENANEDYLYIR